MATASLPCEFKSLFPWCDSRGHTAVFYRREKQNVVRFAVVWFFLWCFCHRLFLIDNFVVVDLPRFSKYSGYYPKKALMFLGTSRTNQSSGTSIEFVPNHTRVLYRVLKPYRTLPNTSVGCLPSKTNPCILLYAR